MPRQAHYHKPIRIGYRLSIVTCQHSFGRYKHLHMELMEGCLCNASRDYELSGEQWKLELAKELREKTGTTQYLHCTSYGACEAELRWQAHKMDADDPRCRDEPELVGTYTDWYALNIQSAEYSDDALKMLRRIYTKTLSQDDVWSMRDASPRHVVKAIKALKGMEVGYGSRVETHGSGNWFIEYESKGTLLDPNYNEQSEALVA